MFEDGDRLLDAVGAVLVLAVLAGVGVVALNVSSTPDGDARPEANWTVERVNDSHVRIAHAGGEPFPADRLLVSVDGVHRNAGWPDPVTEGDATVVQAREGAVIRLYWDGGHAQRERLGRWTV